MHMTPRYVTAFCKKKPNPRLLIIKLDTKGQKCPRGIMKVNTCIFEISATIVINTDYFTLCNFQYRLQNCEKILLPLSFDVYMTARHGYNNIN